MDKYSIIQTINAAKQNMKPRLFISQDAVLYKMKRWGMIDKKKNKPIVCNYMNGKFVGCFKSKNVL